MFLKLNKIALALALGLGTMASTSLSAGAMPMTAGVNSSDNIVEAQYMPPNNRMHRPGSWSMQNHGRRCMTRTQNCRHYYRGYYYQTPWWALPLIIGGAVTNHNHYGQSHARWCQSRYRSYDWRSNTYLGNDGYRHVCRG